MDIFKVRLANLLVLEKRFKLKKEFAEAVDVTPAYIRQFKTGDKTINEKTARKVERHLNLPPSFLDKVQGTQPSVSVIDEDLDVLIAHTEQDGMKDSERFDEYVKQSWLDRNGYLVSELQSIVNTHANMSPEYELGDSLIIYTALKSSPRVYMNNTNYVFSDGMGGYIVHKIYTRMSGDIVLSSLDKQEKPDEVIPSSDVAGLNCLGVIVKMIRYL